MATGTGVGSPRVSFPKGVSGTDTSSVGGSRLQLRFFARERERVLGRGHDAEPVFLERPYDQRGRENLANLELAEGRDRGRSA